MNALYDDGYPPDDPYERIDPLDEMGCYVCVGAGAHSYPFEGQCWCSLIQKRESSIVPDPLFTPYELNHLEFYRHLRETGRI